MTTCTAAPRGNHDYTAPPHNTPDTPRDSTAPGCQAALADHPPWCQNLRVWAVVVYQPGTHDWIRLQTCTPCKDTLEGGKAQVSSVTRAGP